MNAQDLSQATLGEWTTLKEAQAGARDLMAEGAQYVVVKSVALAATTEVPSRKRAIFQSLGSRPGRKAKAPKAPKAPKAASPPLAS
jgi:hypothetical protein